MKGSVLMSPYSIGNQGGVRPRSQGFLATGCLELIQIHWRKYELVPVLPLAAGSAPLLLLQVSLLLKLTLPMSQTQLESIFQTQGAEDLASQYVV